VKQLCVIALSFSHFTCTTNPETQHRHIKTHTETRQQPHQVACDDAGASQELLQDRLVKDWGGKNRSRERVKISFCCLLFSSLLYVHGERGSTDLSRFTSQKTSVGEVKLRYSIMCCKAAE